MAKGKFHYAGRSAEEITRRAKEASGDYDSAVIDGFTGFRAKEGENVIRILPPGWLNYDAKGSVVRDEVYDQWGSGWEIKVWVHSYIGPDKGTFICLDKMKGEPCPICEARREAVDDDERYALSAQPKALCWLIDRNDEKAGPQFWLMPHKKVFKAICAKSTDRKTGAAILIDSPDEGYDIVFAREGTTKTTDYTGFDLESSPLSESEKRVNNWIEFIRENALPDILNYPDPDYMEKVLMGRVSKKKDDDEEEETSGRMKRSVGKKRTDLDEDEEEETPRRARHRSEPEEEDEEDTGSKRRVGKKREEPEEEDEEEAPKSSRGKRVVKPPEDDEDEEAPFDDEKPKGRKRPEPEEEEDEEEDPKPRRKAAAKEEAEEEDDEETPPESKSARKSLERVKPRSGRKAKADDDED